MFIDEKREGETQSTLQRAINLLRTTDVRQVFCAWTDHKGGSCAVYLLRANCIYFSSHIESKIIYKNDNKRLTFKQIADYLEQSSVDE
jgi:hypothetical protein